MTHRRKSLAIALAAMLVSSAAHADPPAAAPSVPEAKASAAKTATIVTLSGLAAVSLVVGTAFWIDSSSKKSDADAYRDSQPAGFCAWGASPGACNTYLDKRVAQDAASSYAKISFAASAATALWALILTDVWPDRPAGTTVSVAPTGSGVSLGFARAF